MIVPTRRSSFRLLAVIICFVAAVWMATACGNCTTVYEENPCVTSSLVEEGTVTATPENTNKRVLEVRDKHFDLLRRQPNFLGISTRYLEDENGEKTQIRGIILAVTEKVDQSTLPVEDRVPTCLEGVPVQIVEEPPDRLLLDLLEDPDTEEDNGRN